MAREKAVGKVQSDQASQQSGNGKENRDGEKKCKGKLENEGTEGKVGVGGENCLVWSPC